MSTVGGQNTQRGRVTWNMSEPFGSLLAPPRSYVHEPTVQLGQSEHANALTTYLWVYVCKRSMQSLRERHHYQVCEYVYTLALQEGTEKGSSAARRGR